VDSKPGQRISVELPARPQGSSNQRLRRTDPFFGREDDPDLARRSARFIPIVIDLLELPILIERPFRLLL
jgi:hypothetical protein